jgi:hypothetical protein
MNKPLEDITKTVMQIIGDSKIEPSYSYEIALMFKKGVAETRFTVTNIISSADGMTMHLEDSFSNQYKYEVHIKAVHKE